MAESRISFEVIVTLMSLNSCFDPSFSETKIRVPSERTTRSKGEIRKAKGKAKHSMIRNATYVSGVTPPVTPLIWFLDKLQNGQRRFRASLNYTGLT
jgi:hypothetical protein